MKIKTDCTKNYMSGMEALEDFGFKKVGLIRITKNFKEITRDLVEKNGKLYYYVGMDHFNTTIYSVTLKEVEKLTGEYTKEMY